jgi:hypothetical protein
VSPDARGGFLPFSAHSPVNAALLERFDFCTQVPVFQTMGPVMQSLGGRGVFDYMDCIINPNL